MGIRFNADEIFAIAEQIEINGAAFYRAAAEKIPTDASRFLHELAAWEDKHKARFAAMREALPDRDREPVTFDPYDEAVLYLKSLADGSVFDPGADPLAQIGADPSYETVLRTALGKEKDSIAFYTGMRRLVPDDLGKDQIDAIIQEEMKHVTMLTRELTALGR